MSKYIFLCVLMNYNIFLIPFIALLFKYLDTRQAEGYDVISDDGLFTLVFVSAIVYITSIITSICIIVDKPVEFLYRIKNPIILIVFFIIFIVCLIVCIKLRLYTKNSYITKNTMRQKNIEGKISLVNKYIAYFNKELRNSSYDNPEKIDSIKNTLKLLEQIKNELEIIYTALDVNIVSESFKDIELASDSLDEIQKEIDKMQAYRSLSDISNDLEDLMKKYDKK